MIKTDICIVGAGPAGTGAALRLHQLGIPCVLVDKAVFPRDKVCGDAIGGKSLSVLRRIDPTILERFEAATDVQVGVWGIRFISPNLRFFDVPFKSKYDKDKDKKLGFVSKRIDFDNLLVEEVKRREGIQLYEGTSIDFYEKTPGGGYRLGNKDRSFLVEAKLLILADGAHSRFSRHHAGLEKEDRHHAGAVRAYYKNVAGLHPDNFIELHFLKEIAPGYLWIFPLPNGQANVGLGMRSDFISRSRYNLKTGMEDLLKTAPHLKERFQNAELVGKVTGYGLPLGSKKRQISGDHFMLTGDAAHLIDPLSGEGIGNALFSGSIAADQAQKCLDNNDFSSKFMEAYDARIERVMGPEMRLSSRLQVLMSHPWLAGMMANFFSRNRRAVVILAEMCVDIEARKKALNPLFWVRLLLGK